MDATEPCAIIRPMRRPRAWAPALCRPGRARRRGPEPPHGRHRRRTRPALRPARPAERPDQPGPARRRVPGLDPATRPAPWPTTSSPAATSMPTTVPRVEALVARHLKKHGGDVENEPGRRPRRPLHPREPGQLGDPDIERLASPSSARTRPRPGGDADRTASYAVGTATSDGQRFRVLRPHARGGLGAVFVALDAELNREVALKQILDHHADDPTSRQRFLLEAEITGGLEHPGIVPVYGLGTYGDGRPYLRHAVHPGRQPQGGDRPLPRRRGARRATPAGARWSCASSCGGSSTSATPSSTPTAAACCTATSSRATSSSASTARRWSSTGAWPRRPGKAEPGGRASGR